ncbi:protein of unknown function [Streptomyces sp. 2224.1]|uniref:DUF4352 domain-containing protein n=1 Tax=Streptomyces sp. 2224.1 TaxID=1881020 RepID=UPI0008949137|nr:DUF4352 domain-containing protein [Streptomyces sp. 2224.1]SED38398.1 protein of unknown function [Streptomyces sp. 2224.1]
MRPYSRSAALFIAALTATGAVAGCSSASGDASKKPSASSTAAGPEKSADAPEGATEPPALSIGKTRTYTARDNSGNATTMSVTFHAAKYVTPSEIGEAKPKGSYAIITVEVTNTGHQDGTFTPYRNMKWKDKATTEQEVSTLISTGTQDVGTTYHPGQGVTGDIVLDVPQKGGSVTYYDTRGTASLRFEMPSR